jgi:HEAT repeat protein
LRYRLTASAALALNWPGGLERLAATTATTRHQALKELESRVTAQDEPLLLELFSSADPFVREISLRALKDVSGANAAGALVKLLDDPEPNVRAAVLAQAGESLATLRGTIALTTAGQSYVTQHYYGYGGGSAEPGVPKYLKRQMVEPFLKSKKPETVALAGYLLTLLGDPAGLAPLEHHWRTKAKEDDAWTRRMYTAVAALGDDAKTPLLEEIYQTLRAQGSYYMRDFYWTIRIMDGPAVLRLRKQIRTDVGMANLQ